MAPQEEELLPENTAGYKLSQPKQTLAEYNKMGKSIERSLQCWLLLALERTLRRTRRDHMQARASAVVLQIRDLEHPALARPDSSHPDSGKTPTRLLSGCQTHQDSNPMLGGIVTQPELRVSQGTYLGRVHSVLPQALVFFHLSQLQPSPSPIFRSSLASILHLYPANPTTRSRSFTSRVSFSSYARSLSSIVLFRLPIPLSHRTYQHRSPSLSDHRYNRLPEVNFERQDVFKPQGHVSGARSGAVPSEGCRFFD